MAFNFRYLSAAQLAGFESYKYNSIDSSPLSNYVMHPFWNSVVKLCPRRVAPNALTLAGFMLTVSNFLLLAWFDHKLVTASFSTLSPDDFVPRCVWLVAAASLFVSHTLDGIDGKQARRLGMSGPLGELFDHGLDSWTAYFIPITVFSALGHLEHSISSGRMLLVLANVWISFLLSHWEKYITGVLFLPWGYDLSQLGVLCLYLVTFAGASSVLKLALYTDSLGVSYITVGHILEVSLWLGCTGTGLPVTLYNIWRSYRAGSSRCKSLGAALLPLLSPALLLCTAFGWARGSPALLLDNHFRLFTFMIGVVISNICCRLIVAQMSGSLVQPLNAMLVPVQMAAALSFLFPAAERALLTVLTVTVTLAHLHYGVCVVRQMCSHFNIPALTVASSRKSD